MKVDGQDRVAHLGPLTFLEQDSLSLDMKLQYLIFH